MKKILTILNPCLTNKNVTLYAKWAAMSAATAIEKVTNALVDSIAFDGKSPFGADINLGFMDMELN